MLSKKKRVTKDLFQTILKTGRTISSPFFMFKYIPQKTSQYAFVVPKTMAKTAIKRNKLRRLGYNTLHLLPIIPSAGIFFYKKPSKTASSREIALDIKDILSKIRPQHE